MPALCRQKISIFKVGINSLNYKLSSRNYEKTSHKRDHPLIDEPFPEKYGLFFVNNRENKKDERRHKITVKQPFYSKFGTGILNFDVKKSSGPRLTSWSTTIK